MLKEAAGLSHDGGQNQHMLGYVQGGLQVTENSVLAAPWAVQAEKIRGRRLGRILALSRPRGRATFLR